MTTIEEYLKLVHDTVIWCETCYFKEKDPFNYRAIHVIVHRHPEFKWDKKSK